jgi:Ca2+-binding RTX toxin-like protein
LWGDAGDDFLIGGSGNDNLKGQNGNDILLAGDLAAAFDASFTNLRAISAAWSLLNPYSDLADDNSDGDIVNDSVVDQLNGGKGSDWFLVSSNDITDYNAKKNTDGDKLTQFS